MIGNRSTRNGSRQKNIIMFCLVLLCLTSSTMPQAFLPSRNRLDPSCKQNLQSDKSKLKMALLSGMGGFQKENLSRKMRIKSKSARSVSNDSIQSATPRTSVDFEALFKWSVGLIGQTSIIFGVLWSLDLIVARYKLSIPFYLKVIFFYLFNQSTVLFSLLPNKKTTSQKMTQKEWEYNKRNRPSWTPPGFVFALMWPLFVFGTRAVTSAMVVSTPGANMSFSSFPIMTLMLHLCIANLWNTINNVEGRLGPCVPALWALALSKAGAAWAFYQVNPLAGKLLALTLTWITAAAALETNTWMINPDPETNKRERFFPVKADKWVSKFRWES